MDNLIVCVKDLKPNDIIFWVDEDDFGLMRTGVVIDVQPDETSEKFVIENEDCIFIWSNVTVQEKDYTNTYTITYKMPTYEEIGVVR